MTRLPKTENGHGQFLTRFPKTENGQRQFLTKLPKTENGQKLTKFPSLDNVVEIDKVSYNVRVPDYMKNLPEEPTEEQIEHVKARIVDEFQDVFSDGG